MIDVVGISTEWERNMHAVKRGVIEAMGMLPEFTGVYIAEDIADSIQRDTGIISKVGNQTVFEGIPLFVDSDLPDQTVIYIWEAK